MENESGVKKFKSLEACLNELKKFLNITANPNSDRHHLETGEGFENFGGLRSREILGNWLICAVLNNDQANHERMKICTDPNGGDGIIFDTRDNKAHCMEHVMVSNWGNSKTDVEVLALEQIVKKNDRGEAYASGKTLVVFIHRPGFGWSPNRIQRQLPSDFKFSSLWMFSLKGESNGIYTYNVAELNSNPSPAWEVAVDVSKNKWNVEKIQ